MSAPATEWAAWHDAHRDPASALSRRLGVVQHQTGRRDDLIGYARA